MSQFNIITVSIFCGDPRNEFMRLDDSGKGKHSFSAKAPDEERKACLRIGVLGPAPNGLAGTLVYIRAQNSLYLVNGPDGDYCSFTGPGIGSEAQFIMVNQNRNQNVVSFLHVGTWRWVQWFNGRIKLRETWPTEQLIRTELPPGVGDWERFQLTNWIDRGLNMQAGQKLLTFYHSEHKEYIRASTEGNGRGACAGKKASDYETCILVDFYGDGPNDVGGTLVTLRARRAGYQFLTVTNHDNHCSFQTYRPNSGQFWIVISLNDSGLVAILHRDTKRWLIWHYGSLKLGAVFRRDPDGSIAGLGPWERFQTADWFIAG